MRTACLAILLSLASAVPAQAPPAHTPGVACTLEAAYPIQIELRLADPMTPGRWLRVEVRVQSDLDLSDVEVQLQADTGVEVAGSRKAAAWTAMAAATPRDLAFDVRVPDVRGPRQVRVQVRGRAGEAWIQRGAVLQLLPQGRHHPPQVREGDGRTVLEYPGAARREP